MLKSLEDLADKNIPIDIQPLFMKYTMDSIGEIGFGINVNSLGGNKEALEFAQSFDMTQETTNWRFYSYPLWKFLPSREFDRNLEILTKFMKNLINERKKDNPKDLEQKTDLLSKFLLATDSEGKPFTEKYLLDILNNFLIAGRDTTAICITWTCYWISQNPEVEKKLINEIHEVIGNDSINSKNINQLKYMKNVIDESLRLCPPVPVDVKIAADDDTLPSGYKISKGGHIYYSPYLTQRMEEYFKDPLKFIPERWSEDTLLPYSFITFNGGPRICLGQQMAYVEVKIALIAIFRKYRLQLLKGHPVTYKRSITFPAKYGMKMTVHSQ